MGLEKLLERLGFVRLRDYGLLMTEDRRIVTTRKVIDDGFGAVVVGYATGDLASLELAPPPLPHVKPAPPPPPVVFAPEPAPPAPVATPAPVPVLFTITKPAPAPPPPVDEEDDWEWEIAAARARAVEEPVTRLPPPARPVEKQPAAPAPWLTKEPLTTPAWTEDTAIRSVTRLAKMSEQKFAPTSPRTIIPVPTLPVANDPQEVTRQLPMPQRFARGTGRY